MLLLLGLTPVGFVLELGLTPVGLGLSPVGFVLELGLTPVGLGLTPERSAPSTDNFMQHSLGRTTV